jgi:hypothetical protein
VRDYFDIDSGEVVLGFTLVDDDNTTGIEKNLSTRGLVTPQSPIHGGIVVEGEVKVLITVWGPTTGLARKSHQANDQNRKTGFETWC